MGRIGMPAFAAAAVLALALALAAAAPPQTCDSGGGDAAGKRGVWEGE